VKIHRGPNTLEGEKAEVDMNTNISRIIGNPAAGQRVRGVFYPGTDKGNGGSVLPTEKPAQNPGQ
jgi:lipopolysaccharide export system protein LptA